MSPFSTSKAPPWQVQLQDLGLVLLTVSLFYCAFPGGGYPWLAWFVLIPLGLAVHGKSAGEAFRLTVCCALLCWLLATWWVIPGVAQVASSSYLVVVPFVLLFCLCYAIPYAVAASLYSYFNWTSSVSGAVKGALLWTTICCLVPHILPGNLAHSQYLYPRIIQVVELAGVPALFFLLHLSMFLGVTAIIHCRRSWRRALWVAGLAISIPLLLLGYGEFRLTQLSRIGTQEILPEVQVGMVQPNISIRSRERIDWLREAPRLLAMSKELVQSKPELDLLVWPEIPPPLSYVQQPADRKLLQDLIGFTRVPLLIAGHQLVDGANHEGGYLNVAEYIDGNGNASVYRKQKLLPFGEYLPFEQEFPWLRTLFPHALRYRPGNSSIPFALTEQVKLLPLICYEAVFPRLVKAGVAAGGNLIVNPVDDAWFGRSRAADVHLALTLFRAVEFRLPIVRASNSGSSALIDFTGEILAGSQTELFVSSTSRGKVRIADIRTVYQHIGNGFLWLTGLLTAGVVFLELRSKRRNSVTP